MQIASDKAVDASDTILHFVINQQKQANLKRKEREEAESISRDIKVQ